MKWILISILIIMGLWLTVDWGLGYPYRKYEDVLSIPAQAKKHLKIPSPNKIYKVPERYELDRLEGFFSDQEKYWKLFHFENIETEMSYSHPLFILVPLMEPTNFGPEVGFQFYTPMKKLIFSFKLKHKIKFERLKLKGEIFNLPISEKYLMTQTEKQIWQDLFSKTIPSTCLECDYYELLYNLYLIKLRDKYFSQNYSNFSFYKSRKFGVLSSHQKNGDLGQELILILHNNYIYPIEIKYLKNSFSAEIIRKKLMETTKVKLSNLDSRVPIYAEYKSLSVKEQRSLKAVNFLFSAWTHDKSNEQYFKLLIRSLERVDMREAAIDQLYKYGLKHFGSTFSKFTETLKETNERKVERKAKEELKKELKEAKNIDVIAPEENFSNPEEKRDYYLKESATKVIEDEEDEISID